jgi:hypothetical protein
MHRAGVAARLCAKKRRIDRERARRPKFVRLSTDSADELNVSAP